MIREVFRSSVLIQPMVKAMVGTAASMMPRSPPSALANWARTAASTVSWAVVSAAVTRRAHRLRTIS